MTFLILVLLATVGVLALFGLDLLVRRPEIGIGLILALVVLDALFAAELMSINVVGFQIELDDAGFSLLALAAVLRLVRGGVSTTQSPLLALGALVIVSLLLGVVLGPIQGAVSEFRPYLKFLASALYASTIRVDRATGQSILRAWLWAGAAITALVIVRWIGRISGVDLGHLDVTYDAAIRVLSGPETMFVASASIILLLSGFRGAGGRTNLYRWGGLSLLVLAVVLNRRTVWLALAVALLALLILERRVGKKVAGAAIAGLMIFTFAIPVFSDPGSSEDGAAQSPADVGTLIWRLEGWAALLESGPEEPADYVIGLPFGSGYERQIQGQELVSHPHSFYLQTFLRTGAIGAGTLILALLVIPRALLRKPSDSTTPLSPHDFVILLAMLAIWMLAWAPGAEQGMILGLSASVAAGHGRLTATKAATRARGAESVIGWR